MYTRQVRKIVKMNNEASEAAGIQSTRTETRNIITELKQLYTHELALPESFGVRRTGRVAAKIHTSLQTNTTLPRLSSTSDNDATVGIAPEGADWYHIYLQKMNRRKKIVKKKIVNVQRNFTLRNKYYILAPSTVRHKDALMLKESFRNIWEVKKRENSILWRVEIRESSADVPQQRSNHRMRHAKLQKDFMVMRKRGKPRGFQEIVPEELNYNGKATNLQYFALCLRIPCQPVAPAGKHTALRDPEKEMLIQMSHTIKFRDRIV